MSAAPASLSIWVGDSAACVRIAGRATFHCTVDFKAAIYGLWDKGFRHFQFELGGCVYMDSTFLGVLAGMGVKLGANGSEAGGGILELVNPSARIRALLDNMGVSNLYHFVETATPCLDRLTPLEPAATAPGRAEFSRICLEAHQTLMEINPENVARFKDVARFLAEDLQKLNQTDPCP